MSEIRLVVCDSERSWSGTIHGSDADRAIAALSADPMTLAELEAAMARFIRRVDGHRLLGNLSPGECDEPYDAGLAVIDLVARLVAVESSYSSPGRSGSVGYHDGHCCTDTELPYHLAEDWLFLSHTRDWQAVAAQRRRERAERPPLDARAVFYGRPLLEFIAWQTFAAFIQRGEAPPAADDGIKEIHAAWLLTPCDDLAGATPREVALERRGHIEWDLQDRCHHWSFLGMCPPGLAEDSFAFRYGGFGTHELVVYYYLVRELLDSCWQQLSKLSESPQRLQAMTVGDFLAEEIPRLERLRDEWLETPNREYHGRTPRSIIHRERLRLPEAMSAREAIHDPDCPCCQMIADMPGPMFWHLDGCNMDDDFAFDMHHRTREEWEQNKREWEEFNERFNAEWKERERLGVAGSADSGERENSVWSSSYRVGDSADVPLGIRVFGIGCHLAELIVNLRGDATIESPVATPPEARQWIDQLNRDFGNLREILQSPEPALAEALYEPVLDRFNETLAAVACARPELTQQCQSLTDELDRLLGPPADTAVGEEDYDIPF